MPSASISTVAGARLDWLRRVPADAGPTRRGVPGLLGTGFAAVGVRAGGSVRASRLGGRCLPLRLN